MNTLLELPKTADGKIDLRQFHLDQAARYRETAQHYKRQLAQCDPLLDRARWDYLARRVNANEIEAGLEIARANEAGKEAA